MANHRQHESLSFFPRTELQNSLWTQMKHRPVTQLFVNVFDQRGNDSFAAAVSIWNSVQNNRRMYVSIV